jgi:osmotically-inducible protein OsmY
MKTTVFKSDTQLRKDVIDEIGRDRRFKAAEVGVEVDQGTKGVANELTVHTPDRAHRSDTELASAVRHALKWDVNTPDEKIEVIVRRGVVTLKGFVDYWYEKTCAAECVMKITGVSAIDDQIAVLPPPVSDTDIGATIDKSIERRIPLAAAHQGPR